MFHAEANRAGSLRPGTYRRKPGNEGSAQCLHPPHVGRKKVTKRKWRSAEREAVYRHLWHIMETGKLPGKAVISDCKKKEMALRNLSWGNIKHFCRNEMKSKGILSHLPPKLELSGL